MPHLLKLDARPLPPNSQSPDLLLKSFKTKLQLPMLIISDLIPGITWLYSKAAFYGHFQDA